MPPTAAQIIVKTLEDSGVSLCFGIPGTHNIELYDALADSKKIRTILVTDEQAASFMGNGAALASGQLACINLVPSAGLTHAMSGIAEAYLDQVPLLVLTCGLRQDTGNAYQLHAVDQVAIAKPVCKKVFEVRKHEEIISAIQEACRIAMTPPYGPTLVEIPVNLYLFLPKNDLYQIPSGKTGPASLWLSEGPCPQGRDEGEDSRDKIISLLNSSQSIGLYIGQGAYEAREEIKILADKLDAIVFTTISGKGIFPENDPRWGWVTLGNAAPSAINKLAQPDCWLAIGCRFGEVATGSYGFGELKNLIHIDIDSEVFNKNYQAKLTWQSDAKDAVIQLLNEPALQTKEKNPKKLQSLAEAHHHIRELQKRDQKNTQNNNPPQGISPSLLFSSLQKNLPADTIYVADSGNGTFLAMEHLRLTQPRSFMGPVDYSCMGYSVPAAIGAKLACPNRFVVSLAGDGAFLMTGLELLTAVHEGTGLLVILLHDGELSQIAQFQRQSLIRAPLTQIAGYDAVQLAESLGVKGLRVTSNSELENKLSEAIALCYQSHPVLLDVAIDYSTPSFFTQGVIKTNFLRFPFKDRLRLAGRFLKRKIIG